MGIVIRQSILTSIISYIGVAVGYVNLLYLYPKFLDAEQVGLTRTIQDAAMLLAPFATFGLGQSIIRFFPHFGNHERQAGSFISLILVLGTLTYGFFLLVFLVFQDYIMSFFNENARDILLYIGLILWLTFFLVILTLLEQYSRSLLNVAFPGFLREVGIRLLQAVLVSLYFLKFISFHQFLIWSVLIYIFIIMILAGHLLWRGHLRLNFEYRSIPKTKAKEIVIFSSLSFVGSSAMILIGKMDSVMVAGMIGLASNAIYTTAFYMATVIEIPKRAITTTASPLIAKAFEKNDIEEVSRIYRKTSINQFIVGALLLIGIWANLQNMFAIMPKGEVYQAGAYVVLIVGCGKLVDMIFGPSSEIIGLSKHYWFNLIVITMLAGIVVVANTLFIPRFGIEGAAYGSVLALVSYNATKFVFIWFTLRIQPFSLSTLKVLAIAVAVAILNYYLPTASHVLLDIIYRSVTITVVYGTLILVTNSSQEVNNLANTVLKKMSIRK